MGILLTRTGNEATPDFLEVEARKHETNQFKWQPMLQ